MKRFYTWTLVFGMVSFVGTFPLFAQQKLAQTGMKFLNVGLEARAVALGEAVTSNEGGSAAMFFNPASMARLQGSVSVQGGQARWIADIKHTFGSIAFSPSHGEYGVIGISVQSVDYGDFQETIRSANAQGFLDLGTFKPMALMVGLGYARALSDKFSVGGNVKYVRQSLGSVLNTTGGEKEGNTTSVFAFDFGILYRTGFRSLNFGMTVRNFAKEVQFQKEGFQLPLTFRIGVSMNVLDLIQTDSKVHSFLLTFDAEHPRDFSELVRFGGEYVFMEFLSLRIGYISPADEQKLSYGVGLQKEFEGFGFGVDYALTPFGVFDNVQRFSLHFSF